MIRQFKTLYELKDYQKRSKEVFTDEDIVFIQDEDTVYKFNNETQNWEQSQGTGKIDTKMSLFELNKQIMGQMPSYTLEQWEKETLTIDEWDKQINGRYYMLLCKEISYYTVFVNDGYELHSLGNAVRECLEFVGDVICIDYNDPYCIEIWIKIENEINCLHLFCYDEGVVSFKR